MFNYFCLKYFFGVRPILLGLVYIMQTRLQKLHNIYKIINIFVKFYLKIDNRKFFLYIITNEKEKNYGR